MVPISITITKDHCVRYCCFSKRHQLCTMSAYGATLDAMDASLPHNGCRQSIRVTSGENVIRYPVVILSLRWRHDDQDGVLNHQPYHCLLNRLFRRRSKKTSKLRVTGLCAVNSPETGEFPAQMASNAEHVSIWWRHHGDKHFPNRCNSVHMSTYVIV